MPPRRSRSRRPPPRRDSSRDLRPTGRIQFVRRTIPLPASPLTLCSVGGDDAGNGAAERWELICRDGWEWQRTAGQQVIVRTAILSADQAMVVREWIERIKDPAAWWAVSRELHSPDSSAEVSRALAQAPWLTEVLPALLEASTEGSPPPPPDA